MTKKEIIEEVLDILRNTDQDEAIEVCINLDVDYILERMEEGDGE